MRKDYSLAVYDYQGNKMVDLSSYNIYIQGEAYNINHHRETNGYHELTFNVPSKIQNNDGELIDNFRLDSLKNEFIVRLTNNGWQRHFVIKDVEKQRDDNGITSFAIKCIDKSFDRLSKSGLSLYFDEETGTAEELLILVLKNSDWSVGEVDDFKEEDSNEIKVRTLKGERSNRFALVQEICALFGCFPIFHEDTRTIDLKSEIGLDRGVQFRYRKNLKNITQTLESNDIITKLWVEGGDNPNEGLTLIESINPTRENYILNFQYYKDLGLITTQQSIMIEQFEYNIMSINTQIDGYFNSIAAKMLDKTYKRSELESKDITKVSKEQAIIEIGQKIAIEKNTTVKNQLISQRNTLQDEVNILSSDISLLRSQISSLESQIAQAESDLQGKLSEKDMLIKNFELELGDFIKEGIYQNINYVDSYALYQDSLKISERMSYPRVSYESNVLDLSKLTGYALEEFDVGDKVYIVDETLKIDTNGRITEIDEVLDNPSETTVVLSNYDTKVEDLLSKIITASTIINSRKEIYDRAQGINADGTLNYDLLQKTFDSNLFQVKFGTDNKVVQDNLGITIIDLVDEDRYVRINAGGIFVTNDGGASWKHAVSADGISALNIVSGMIDTKQLQIWNSERPKFFWNDEGLFAYGVYDDQWIRFNEDGLYFTRDNGDTYDLVANWDGVIIGNINAKDLETKTGAQSKADIALDHARNYTDNLGDSLGNLAYQDLVQAAMLGNTIIQGGYIRTDLLQVDYLSALSANLGEVTAGTLTGVTLISKTGDDAIEIQGNTLTSYDGVNKAIELKRRQIYFYDAPDYSSGYFLGGIGTTYLVEDPTSRGIMIFGKKEVGSQTYLAFGLAKNDTNMTVGFKLKPSNYLSSGAAMDLEISSFAYFNKSATFNSSAIFNSSTVFTDSVRIYSNISPNSDLGASLGSSNRKWTNIYVRNVVSDTSLNLKSGSSIISDSTILPASTNTYGLGNSSSRWSGVFLNNNPNVSSDVRIKSNIQNLPEELLDELSEIKPKMFEVNNELHFGYIAQDVERALYKYAVKTVGWENAKNYMDNFTMLYKDESYLSLIYAEIAVLKEAEMQRRIDRLENKISELEEIINECRH